METKVFAIQETPRIAAGDFDFIQGLLPAEAQHMFDPGVDYKQVIDRTVRGQTSNIKDNEDAFSEAYAKLADPAWASAYGRHVVGKQEAGESPAPLAAYLSTLASNVVSDWKGQFSRHQEDVGPQVSLSGEAGGEGSSMEGLIGDPSSRTPGQQMEQEGYVEKLREHLSQSIRGWTEEDGEPGLAQEVFEHLLMGQLYETDVRRVGPTQVVDALNTTRPEGEKLSIGKVGPVLNEVRQQIEVYVGGDPIDLDQPTESGEWEQAFDKAWKAPEPEPEILEAPVTQEQAEVPSPDDIPLPEEEGEGGINDPTNTSLWTPSNTRGWYVSPGGDNVALAWFDPSQVPEDYRNRRNWPDDMNTTARWVHAKNRRTRGGDPRRGNVRIQDLDESGNLSEYTEPSGKLGYVIPLGALDLNKGASDYRSRRLHREQERRHRQQMGEE